MSWRSWTVIEEIPIVTAEATHKTAQAYSVRSFHGF